MTTVFDIYDSMKKQIAEWITEGGTEYARKSTLASFDHTIRLQILERAEVLVNSPEATISFLYQINTSLGAINSALMDFELEPFTLRDCPFINEALIVAVENYYVDRIEDIFTAMDKAYERGIDESE